MREKYLLVFGYTKLHCFFISKVILDPEFSDRRVIKILSPSINGSSLLLRVRGALLNIITFFLFRFMVFVGKDVALLLPHPEHLLSNFFFFSPKIKKIYIVEDGLMNYLDVKLQGYYKYRSEKRRKIGKLLFYRYRTVEGYLSGCDERKVEASFVRFPEYVFKPEKHGRLKKILQSRELLHDIDERAVLFLDQDIEAVYEKDEAAKLRKKIYTALSAFSTVYVKLHHDYLSKSEGKIDIPKDFILLDTSMQKKMAEELIKPLRIGNVMGFSSSALVNINSFYDGVKCYSCTSENHFVSTYKGSCPLADLMSDFGVLIVR